MIKTKLKEATKDGSQPIAGYLVHQIVEYTHTPAADLHAIERHLISCLRASSVHVVIKGLQLVKEICVKGHESFRERMKNHEQRFHDCASWNGPPDPMCGDAFNQKLRDLSAECINIIWNHGTSLGAGAVVQHKTTPSRIIGYGMADYTQRRTPSSSAPPIGGWLLNDILSASSQLARSYTSALLGESLASYLIPNPTPSHHAPSRPTPANDGPVQQLGYCPPVLPDEMEQQEFVADVKPPGQPLQQCPFIGKPAAVFAPQRITLEWSDCRKQRRLQCIVRQVVAMPTWSEVWPCRASLAQFCNAFAAEESEDVASALSEHLQLTQPWQLQLRALYAVEWVLRHGTTDQVAAFTKVLSCDRGPLHNLLGVVHTSVAAKARIVLLHMGCDVHQREMAEQPTAVESLISNEAIGGSPKVSAEAAAAAAPVDQGNCSETVSIASALNFLQPDWPVSGLATGTATPSDDDIFGGVPSPSDTIDSSSSPLADLESHPFAWVERVVQQTTK